jgi:hypothetical protein
MNIDWRRAPSHAAVGGEQKEQAMTEIPPEPNDSPDPDAQPESEPGVTGDDPETVIDPGSDAVGNSESS